MSPERDALEHVEAAEKLFVRIQQIIDEGNGSQYSIDVLSDLRRLALVLREHIAVFDQDGNVVQPAGTFARAPSETATAGPSGECTLS